MEYANKALNTINVNIKDLHGWTALHDATRKGHSEVLEHLLVVNDIDVNITDRNYNTVLYLALPNRHDEVKQYLIMK